MKTLVRLVVTLLLIVGWGLAVSSLHVVRTNDSVTIVPKNRLGVFHSYVDVRGWTLDQVKSNPEVAQRLIDVGKVELLAHVTEHSSTEDLQRQLRSAIQDGRDAKTATASADWKSKLPDIRF